MTRFHHLIFVLCLFLGACGGGGGGGSGSSDAVVPGPTPTPTPGPTSTALPSAVALHSTLDSFSQSEITFTVTAHVADGNSNTVSNLTAVNVKPSSSVKDGSNPSITFSQNLVSVGCSSSASKGPYSAMMVLDRSGSMASNDASNVVLTAANTFATSLATGENMSVMAFPEESSANRPFRCTVYGSGFDANSPAWVATINSLATPGGNTPLYDCASNAINYTSTNATNSNRAILLFTDGEDTASTETPDTVIGSAQSAGIPIYALALASANKLELGRMAQATGGGLMVASDVRQLITAYGTLGGVLSGSRATCQISMRVNINGASYVQSGYSNVPVTLEVDGVPIQIMANLPVSWQ